MDITDMQRQLREFAAERGWETYQTPKNLSAVLVGEAPELLEPIADRKRSSLSNRVRGNDGPG
jgi:NTP pyrophosphatase (non-canonical NTP hydrolase)